ncbi:MAG: DUF2721 domain-containing protein [Verrucomicrobiales bacterium]|jgi:hypothetical protein|nr:DUF2721 domain-containing protein [Verrucomicrobiales bacterium]
MTFLTISTPALLFPAVSLLFLAYTNRFLHLAALVRQLHRDWVERQDDCLRAQIDNMRKRLALIRWMQLLGAVSILLCVVAMVAVMLEANLTGWIAFFAALLFMGGSLLCLILEVACSGGALKILLDRVERE